MHPNVRRSAVNRLLASLPREEHKRLSPELKPIALAFGEVLYEPGDTIKHVYFPNDSIVSLLSAMPERSTLEVGMVGNEGMAGLSVFAGVNVSLTRAIVQGAGSAMRMTAAVVRQEANRLGPFHQLLHRYTHSLQSQVSQSAACNRFHSVNDRLARWLLMTSDRLGTDEFRLTQEFMSNMLGVRREGVNQSAGTLQSAKLIRYSRGMITILNRRRLQVNACECYSIMKAESDQYLN
ncbi:MAG TPA: Crp/Fnr family transcriptional regulator [Pyrinomonadaceae bacterium]|jgi:CRP-like cAMP-binding protein|nr:Crp/Fnr family transcriptional regulator [Pyrinomonadaceae bacterium]